MDADCFLIRTWELYCLDIIVIHPLLIMNLWSIVIVSCLFYIDYAHVQVFSRSGIISAA